MFEVHLYSDKRIVLKHEQQQQTDIVTEKGGRESCDHGYATTKKVTSKASSLYQY